MSRSPCGALGSSMTEILFYHLQRQPLERVLPTLLESRLSAAGASWCRLPPRNGAEALDAHLWTFRDDSFLPHGIWREGEAREQPILLTVHDDNPKRSDRGGSSSTAWRFRRMSRPMTASCCWFNGEDPDASMLPAARWSEASKTASRSPIGNPTTLGRWQRKA